MRYRRLSSDAWCGKGKKVPRFVTPAGQEDHRIRVARERRERTRAHLLDAVLSVYPGDGANGPAVIDDVIREAGVSRGTFYKYFPSLEEAVAELGNELAREMAEAYAAFLNLIPTVIDRVATAVAACLSRAAAEPRWGMFVAHLNHMREGDNPAFRDMAANLVQGRDAGVFRFDSVDAAVDLMAGTLIESIKRLLRGAPSDDYVEQVTVMLLHGLGAPRAAARRAAAAASRRFRHEDAPLGGWASPSRLGGGVTALRGGDGEASSIPTS